MAPKPPANTESGLYEGDNRDFQLRDLQHFAYEVDPVTGKTFVRTVSTLSISASDLQIGAVEIKDQDTNERAKVEISGSDDESNTANKLQISAWLKAFNGSTWDRVRSSITTATSALKGWLNTLPYAVYNQSPAIRSEGQGGPFQSTNEGSLKTRSDAWDSLSQADRQIEQSPIYTRYEYNPLAKLTNIPANTTAYLYFDLAGFKYFGIQNKVIFGTDSITLETEATWQDDGTPQGSCAYDPTTNSWFGVASVTNQDVIFDKNTPTTAKFVREKYTTSNTGGNDTSLTAHERSIY